MINCHRGFIHLVIYLDKIYAEDGAVDDFSQVRSFKNELKKVTFQIFWMPKNMKLVGNLVKFEPIIKILVKILEILVNSTSTLRLWSPSANINREVGSTKDVVLVTSI